MKSPIKAKPLRNPGESLERRLTNLVLDDILFHYLACVFVVAIAGLEWWRWYSNAPPGPFIFSIIAGLVVLFSVWKVRGAWREAKNVKLGLSGERAVGQFLDMLREKGARVLHDVPGDGFNIDHVVVHSSGVYAIETKTLSKPDRGEAKLIYDGESILKNGLAPDRNPVTQALAGSRWLRDLMRESTGKNFPVKPVVLYPGWYIQPTSEARASEVWVLNPKALPAFIENSREQLRPEDVHLCAFHLQKYIRAS